MTDTTNVTITTQETSGNGNWMPHVGQETMDFLTRSAPEESRDSLEADAISILSKGVSPVETARNADRTCYWVCPKRQDHVV